MKVKIVWGLSLETGFPVALDIVDEKLDAEDPGWIEVVAEDWRNESDVYSDVVILSAEIEDAVLDCVLMKKNQ